MDSTTVVNLHSSQQSMGEGASSSDLPSFASRAGENAGSKPKRPPTVTPKRFTRFFTPRHSVLESRRSKHASKASRQLRDITKNAVNRKARSPRQTQAQAKVQHIDQEASTPRRNKRRKLSSVLDSSPLQLQSSPSKRVGGEFKPIDIFDDEAAASVDGDDLDRLCDQFARVPTPVHRLRSNHTSHRLLERSFGGRLALDRGRVRDACVDWRHAASSFHSSSRDVYKFNSTALPFCTASCNSNSLVAIGDESGGIAIVDSSASQGIDFSQAHISFKAHGNAIMDLAFSSDDYLLATASGDQTARITDMRTQQVRYIMAGHVSSVKQVRFQPGNDSVLATSSRDGSVQIWDLRCRGTMVPQTELFITVDQNDNHSYLPSKRKTIYAETCIAIRDAHSNNPPASSAPRNPRTDMFTNPIPASSRRNEVSITAISFLPGDRSHLLLSASEANASIKLWDIRGKYSTRRGPAVPVSSTLEPPSHITARRFGLTSLALSGDGGRLYASCRDSTVYAYSTNHLILGQGPEFDAAKCKFRSSGAEAKVGLAPLYGLRHPQMKVSSFYIKAALRKAKGDKEEMLAVGSRDGCAVLFPTDEAYLRRKEERREEEEEDEEVDLLGTPIRRPVVMRSGVEAPRGLDVEDRDEGMPVPEMGTALVRGHKKEVTSVSWTADGELISVSDDWTARCWREGPQARQLRIGGEGEGQRWSCGWAEVDADFDDDE